MSKLFKRRALEATVESCSSVCNSITFQRACNSDGLSQGTGRVTVAGNCNPLEQPRCQVAGNPAAELERLHRQDRLPLRIGTVGAARAGKRACSTTSGRPARPSESPGPIPACPLISNTRFTAPDHGCTLGPPTGCISALVGRCISLVRTNGQVAKNNQLRWESWPYCPAMPIGGER